MTEPAPRFALAGLTMDDLIQLLWIVVDGRRDVQPTGALCRRIDAAIKAADPEWDAWRRRRYKCARRGAP